MQNGKLNLYVEKKKAGNKGKKGGKKQRTKRRIENKYEDGRLELNIWIITLNTNTLTTLNESQNVRLNKKADSTICHPQEIHFK